MNGILLLVLRSETDRIILSHDKLEINILEVELLDDSKSKA